MPSLQMGSYKLSLFSNSYGLASDSVNIEYDFKISSIFPSECGTGGGTLLTISGTGFSEETKGSLCGKDLKFVKFEIPENFENEEQLIFETVPIGDISKCDKGIELSEIDRSTGVIHTIPEEIDNKRRRRNVQGFKVWLEIYQCIFLFNFFKRRVNSRRRLIRN